MKGLFGFHSFTRCDTVSSFAGHGELKPLMFLFNKDKYVDTFSSVGEDIDRGEEKTNSLEIFTIHMYGKGEKHLLNYYQLEKTFSTNTVNALHIITYIWRQCFNPMTEADEPEGYGGT